MSTIKHDEVRGNRIDGDVCCDCASDAEQNAATLDEIWTEEDFEDGESTVYCDRCKKQL